LWIVDCGASLWDCGWLIGRHRASCCGNCRHYTRYRQSGCTGVHASTNEHYLPLLYILPLQEKNEPVRFFADRVTMGSLSMRSLWIQ
jgi:aromatic ring-opening dioxygenase catalytic subunit (LigB family)